MTVTDHQRLKARQRAERGTHPEDHALRVHRALGWLGRAEQLSAQDDVDGPLVIETMRDHPASLWGPAVYPVVR